jgi:hypothetical protein
MVREMVASPTARTPRETMPSTISSSSQGWRSPAARRARLRNPARCLVLLAGGRPPAGRATVNQLPPNPMSGAHSSRA